MPNKRAIWILALALGLGLAAGFWFGRGGAPRPPAPLANEETPVAQAPQEPAATEAPVVETPVAAPAGPKLALVIDDWGYNTKYLPNLKALPIKMTVAVIPGLDFSRACAQAAHEDGKEVIMHLPMEPLARLPLVPGTLMVGMDGATVAALCEKHAQSVPYMVGLNNHEGSKASADPALMGAVARWLKSKDYYFLDSVTTPHSVIPQEAKQASVPYARNKVFLDNLSNKGAIDKELRSALRMAQKYGSCIAIGHPRPNTIEVVERLVPEFQAQGVNFVFVSELVGPDGNR